MTANIHPDTGIRYGTIYAHHIHPDVWDELTIQKGHDPYYKEALADFARENRHDERGRFRSQNEIEEAFCQAYNPDEPVYEGEVDGVQYRATWLGGAPFLFVFMSPHVGKFDICSPCVPNAVSLESPNPNGYEGYDVPADWRIGEDD